MQKAIKRYFPVFVLPTMIAFTIGFIAPFLLGIYLSFCKFTPVTDVHDLSGLRIMEGISGSYIFTLSVVYRAVYSTFHVIDQCTGICGGVGIDKTSTREKYFRTVFFMPNLIGGIILGYIWQLLLNGVLAHWGKTLTYSGTYGLMGMIILCAATDWIYDDHLHFRHSEYSRRADRSGED